MGRGMKKSERLREMERLYFQHREGWSDMELAERFGVDRTTIFRDRTELECEVPLQEVETGKYTVDRMKYISAVRLNLTEALALYLAARRMSRHTRTYQTHVVSALEKLAVALKEPMTEHLVHAATSLEQQPPRPERGRILETLTRGWAEHLQVRLTYQGLRADRPTTHLFSPYLIEPSIWSDAIYVIGYSDVFDALTTFSVERILEAHLSTAPFTIPETFDEQALLRFTWGIWTSQQEPVAVRLKFTGSAALTRLKESIWHPLQKPLVETPDGGCLWEAPVAEPREMLPWIRGWGGSCEVLEPVWLREELVREVRRMAKAYGVTKMAKLPEYQLLWAKADKSGKTHPLICHLLDVAAVMQILWDEGLPESIRTQISSALGLTFSEAGKTIAFLAGSHDLGKASPCFQCRNAQAWQELQKETNLSTGGCSSKDTCYHGTITTATLSFWLEQNLDFSKDWAQWAAVTVGGHHGHWPTAVELEAYAPPMKCGQGKWENIRHDLLQKLRTLFKPVTPIPPNLSVQERNAFFALLGGLTTIVDWLGSNEAYFPFVEADIDLEEYFIQAIDKARRALRETGWLEWLPPSDTIDFKILCDVTDLRPLQTAVVHLASQMSGPGMVIIEAPTGVGKTEAALYLADYWVYTLQQRGTYVAMPTMATSNLMFERVKKVLKCRYPDSILNYHLLHGNALLLNSDVLPRLTKIGAREEKQGTIAALSWFTKAKRGLLAPFAVGTVDQTLLSILQTPHFFVRLLGLSHKTIIFDEVHAYDTYMEELFFLLLHWLRAVNASVIILSATLPKATRLKLVAAYTGIDEKEVKFPNEARYPIVTWTSGDPPQVISLPLTDERKGILETISHNPLKIADKLALLLRDGGCAAVLCNTVERAREVFETLSTDPRLKTVIAAEDFTLFHARFPLAWRLEIEELVKNRFGKPEHEEAAKQPRRPAIVVATQVIEQSLDLDFDLMVSDLAPIDLIIQRAGRLHRHAERDALRPESLHQARLLVAIPNLNAEGLPDFPRGDQWIYGTYWLLRSYLALRDLPALVTPRDTSALIESVYDRHITLPGADSAPFASALQSAWEKSDADRQKAKSEADKNLIVSPTAIDFLEHPNADLEEDNPDLHRYRQAATRLSPPSVTLICLHRARDGKLLLDPESKGLVVSIEDEPDQAMVRELVNRKVEVSNHDLVSYFVLREVPKTWRNIAWLRHARLAIFREGGVCEYDDMPFALKLDRKLGLYMEDKQ